MERVQDLIPQLLSRMHVETLIHGNITKLQALDLMSIIESQLEENIKWRPLLASQLVRDREYQLSPDNQYVFEKTNSIHKSSSVEAYYQCGLQVKIMSLIN